MQVKFYINDKSDIELPISERDRTNSTNLSKK